MARTASARVTKASEQPPARHRVIDLVHLAKQTLGDRSLEQEVLRMFAEASKVYLQRVCDAQSHDDLKISLHSLKGAAAGIGANGIAKVARAAEDELRKTDKLAEETISDIGFAVEEVSVFIADILES